MPGESAKIGEIRVDVVANTAGAEAGLDRTEQKARGLGRAFGSLRRLLSQTLIPAAVFAGAVRLLQNWQRIRNSAAEYGRTATESARQIEDGINRQIALMRTLDGVERELLKVEHQRRDAIGQINAGLETQLKAMTENVSLTGGLAFIWDKIAFDLGISHERLTGIERLIDETNSATDAASQAFERLKKETEAAARATSIIAERTRRLKDASATEGGLRAVDMSRIEQLLTIIMKQRTGRGLN